MSLRSRKRRKLRRHPPPPPVLCEARRLPPYDRAKEHRFYSALAHSGMYHAAQQGLVVLRGPLYPMPFGG